MPLVGGVAGLCSQWVSTSPSTRGLTISPPQQQLPHPARQELREHYVLYIP